MSMWKKWFRMRRIPFFTNLLDTPFLFPRVS